MAVTDDAAEREYWDGRGVLLLWAAMLAGPAAWTIDQGLGYAGVKPSCFGGSDMPLLLISALALAITAAGGWLAWRCFRSVRHAAEDGGRVVDRSYFMALVAIGFNVLIALLILTAAVPIFVLSPCE